MKTLFKLFLLCCLLATSQFTQAQNNPDKIVEAFFDNYVNAGASEALDQLYASNKWMSRATDAINSLKSKLEGLNEDFVGPFYGYELIVEKKLSQSFILRSYLVKYDRQPIRFTFQFYKPDNKWVVHSFQYDGNVGDEIEEAAKLYYLDLD
ncbi:hypothetical protein [Jiulongibacter sediminis]|uniref:DUF3887 domain-containing protein n=1 Tax=Jiulongibacter sediminis TaxID=1605367 RepID=A0A0P7C7U2_9BACT|nr:hypothetical protein [Jiulongibacter sediminis]KPM49634.1 hypothetical protein AFM12_03300 [Jiulongibacter sediminis]TBX26672.1 hypothetical protein TK44_03305 [Jiulongibacter sediminis]